MNARIGFLIAAICSLAPFAAAADEPRIIRDVEFAKAGDHALALDLYIPAGPQKPMLIVYVHGGAWRAGSKSDMPLGSLLQRGFAVASVDYRLSTEAPFPAQAHDIKAAIRYLRAKGKELGVDPTRIAIAGSSAGGHLAALIGVTAGVKELEGTLGSFPEESSRVQAIIDLYGASNLETILSQSTEHGLSVRVPRAAAFARRAAHGKGRAGETGQPGRAHRCERSAAAADPRRRRSADAVPAIGGAESGV